MMSMMRMTTTTMWRMIAFYTSLPAIRTKIIPAATAALAATTAQTPITLRSSPKVLRAHAQLCEKRSRGDASPQ